MFQLFFIFYFIFNSVFGIDIKCEIGINKSIIAWTEKELNLLSSKLPSNIKILEVEYGPEWIYIYGRLDGQVVKLADIDIFVRGKVIDFHRDVIPQVRKFGLGDFMVRAALEQNPHITQIHHYLIDINRNIFAESLLKEAGLHPGLISPEKYKDFSDYFYKVGKDAFLKRPLPEQNELITKAIRETPAYKSVAKVGFGHICPQSIVLSITDRLIIEFKSCKS